MTIEEIKDKLYYMARSKEDADVLSAALDLLRTHPDAQPNEPLTLEELREMDGQPVWTHSDIFPGDCGCRVVKKADVLDVEFTDRQCFRLTDYGKSWLAYRRPPKEG